jgi:hypothetical protein
MSVNTNHDTPQQWDACSFENPPNYWRDPTPITPPLGFAVSSLQPNPNQILSRLRSGQP